MSLNLVTEERAAELLATPRGTLRYWRHRGTGPQCIRLGRCIKYDVAELEAFVSQRRIGLPTQIQGVAHGTVQAAR